ncbi:MAG: ion transporter [Lachnospiraceae bacterium]|nr:ion transporter [Lachnospiraceae bacterium]
MTGKVRRQYKKRIFDIIQIGTQVDVPSTLFDIFIVLMIVLSITVTVLQTFEQMEPYKELLNRVEFFTIIVFIIEYVLRVYTSDLLYPGKTKGRALLAFVFSFYGMVDLLTIFSYFSVLYSNGIVTFRMIRAVRILRLFKVNKSFDAFNVVSDVLKEKKNQIISSIFIVAMLMLAASLCMYGFEHDMQPDKFNNAFSGVWWAMSTVLTVGYGDIYPVTIGGRIAAIVIALLGVCAVAIPTGVISAGFVDYYSRLKTDAGEIKLPEDVTRMLKNQASKAGLSVNTYIEQLVLEKRLERTGGRQEEQEKAGNAEQKSGKKSAGTKRKR